MATIASKIRNIFLSNVHSLLDKVIDLNSIESIKQYIRDLEGAIDQSEGEAATAEGNAATAKSKLDQYNIQIKELNTNIDFILGDGDDSNDHLAKPLEVRLMGLEQNRATAEQEYQTYQATMEAIDKAVAGLKAKHESMLTQVRLLDSQSRSTAARNHAAEAIEAASKLTDAPSVDNVAARVTSESNIADARLRRALGSMETGLSQDATLAQAEGRLAARKAALQKKS